MNETENATNNYSNLMGNQESFEHILPKKHKFGITGYEHSR
jgi:hypothetical protein